MRISRYCFFAVGMALCVPTLSFAQAGGLDSLAKRLAAAGNYTANAEFEVWLPSAADPVTYTMTLAQAPAAAGDSLMPCNYLIEWKLTTVPNRSQGFSAYFDGNHYRFSANRLQEYHATADSSAFMPSGKLQNGVQHTAQFASLLPAVLADELAGMAADSTGKYSWRMSRRGDFTTVEGKRTYQGEVLRNFKYVFDTASSLPVQLDIDTSPDQISEQNITVRYQNAPMRHVPAAESELVALFPDEFGKYRRSNFRLESLLGQAAPEFSVNLVGGDRYTHHRGDSFGAPTIIVFIDPKVGSAEETIRAVRQAADDYPGALLTIFAVVDNRIEEVEDLLGGARSDELVLSGARAMARDFGVVDYPTIAVCDIGGNITAVKVGMNKKLADEVIQAVMGALR